jgi:putative flippase GtrA
MGSSARAVGGQAARFLVAGGFVTAVSALTYWCAVRLLSIEPLLAAVIGHLVGLLIGFRLHAHWTFAGTSAASPDSAQNIRFVAVSLSGLLCNLFWVQLLVHVLGAPDWAPTIPMIFATPPLTFAMNRCWVFARSEQAQSPNG